MVAVQYNSHLHTRRLDARTWNFICSSLDNLCVPIHGWIVMTLIRQCEKGLGADEDDDEDEDEDMDGSKKKKKKK